MKKVISVLMCIAVIFGTVLCFSSCSKHKQDESWKNDGSYDLTVPTVGENGWYLVFEDDFEGNALNQNIKFGENYVGNTDIWTYSPHAIRWASNDEDKPEQACYWCPELVEVSNSNLIIHSRYETNHTCDGDCPKAGRFTGGIETRKIVGDNNNNKGTDDEMLFSQAFGYFECKVKFPNSKGLWSAFWLQSSNMRQVGNQGEDGTEIDVYESAFVNSKTSKMGHALLWDGYGKSAKSSPYITDLAQNLYDGYHTFALKWTPEYYAFYIDGVPTWATKDGDVSKVREFLRLTVEIDAGDGWGPHGQKIGKFDDSAPADDFLVDYVKVYQNSAFEQEIKADDYYNGTFDLD